MDKVLVYIPKKKPLNIKKKNKCHYLECKLVFNSKEKVGIAHGIDLDLILKVMLLKIHQDII